MIAIRDRGFANVGLYPSSIGEMFELLLAGDNHWDLSVSNIFFQARQLAASAVSENSETSLVVAALLFRPCQMLASGLAPLANTEASTQANSQRIKLATNAKVLTTTQAFVIAWPALPSLGGLARQPLH